MMSPRLPLILSSLLIGCAVSFPTAPGSCNSPNPLSSSHIDPNADGNGELSDFGLVVRIDGADLTPNSANDFGIMMSHEMEIISTTDGNTFAGFLMKLYDSNSVIDAVGFLAPQDGDGDAAVLPACASTDLAGSVGHTNNNEKVSVGGILEVEDPTNGLTLEVTVVVANDPTGASSVWYSSTFTLNAVEGDTVVTPQPNPPSMTPPAPTAAPPTGPTYSAASKSAMINFVVAGAAAVVAMVA